MFFFIIVTNNIKDGDNEDKEEESDMDEKSDFVFVMVVVVVIVESPAVSKFKSLHFGIHLCSSSVTAFNISAK